ncbi:hypothetical protein [Neorhizobium vignae]|jgi:NAD(P)-dependent dehydrogenase (short-subunit alcohol dehydrogenase family)|nr:hypothetical protein [Neorhizobium vignae]
MTKKPIALIAGANKGRGKEVARQLGGLGCRSILAAVMSSADRPQRTS